MNKQQEDILFFAFRYALTRRTYAVDIVVEEITKKWNELEKTIQEQFQREIEQSFSNEVHGETHRDWEKILELKLL